MDISRGCNVKICLHKVTVGYLFKYQIYIKVIDGHLWVSGSQRGYPQFQQRIIIFPFSDTLKWRPGLGHFFVGSVHFGLLA